MKLILSGGLNKYDPDGYKKSYFYKYSKTVKSLIDSGKKVCFVTLAKPDNYYDEHITPQFGTKVDIIDYEFKKVDWTIYDLIFLCGGNQFKLKNGLEKKKFMFDKLKKDIVILGDSAGAIIMGTYFYGSEDGTKITFYKGFYPKTETIVIVHANNPRYTNDKLIKIVEKFAEKKGLRILRLKDSETKLFDEKSGKFTDFVFQDLF